MTDYAELRAAMESATPGPWHTKTECPARCCWHVFPSVELYGAGEDTPVVMGECSEADARFMTLARNALPAILAERDHYATECQEQARLLGMSAERELKLMAESDALRDALQVMIETAERVDGWQSFPNEPIEKARSALAAMGKLK